jgi:hypothetical protein
MPGSSAPLVTTLRDDRISERSNFGCTTGASYSYNISYKSVDRLQSYHEGHKDMMLFACHYSKRKIGSNSSIRKQFCQLEEYLNII